MIKTENMKEKEEIKAYKMAEVIYRTAKELYQKRGRKKQGKQRMRKIKR